MARSSRFFPGKDGLVHISELSEDPAIRVNRVEDVLSVGDEITVMVTRGGAERKGEPFSQIGDYRRNP